MPVYIDDMYKHSMGKFRRMKMSHMVADTLDELYEMADKIGVSRKWVQNLELGKGRVHFDIAMNARKKAVQNGAIEISMRSLVMLCFHWKDMEKKL